MIAAFVNGKAILYQIANIAGKHSWNKPLNHFSLLKMLVDTSLYYAAGTGSSYITNGERERLGNIAAKKPRSPQEFLNLLIEVNRKVAHKDKERVSMSCIAVDMPAKGEPVHTVSNGTQHISPADIPFVLFGIDTTEMTQLNVSRMPGGKNHNLPQEEINKMLDQIETNAVTPRKINE